MEYVLLAIVAVVFITTIGGVWLQRRRETPLRREVRSKGITFQISLPLVKERQSTGFPRWLALNSVMALYVRGDAIEISSTILPFRVIMGVEYYFKASQTTIEVSQEPSALSKMDWIVITGRRDGEEVKLAITKRDPGQLHEAWNALVAAGSVPIGPPPDRPHLITGGLQGWLFPLLTSGSLARTQVNDESTAIHTTGVVLAADRSARAAAPMDEETPFIADRNLRELHSARCVGGHHPVNHSTCAGGYRARASGRAALAVDCFSAGRTACHGDGRQIND